MAVSAAIAARTLRRYPRNALKSKYRPVDLRSVPGPSPELKNALIVAKDSYSEVPLHTLQGAGSTAMPAGRGGPSAGRPAQSAPRGKHASMLGGATCPARDSSGGRPAVIRPLLSLARSSQLLGPDAGRGDPLGIWTQGTDEGAALTRCCAHCFNRALQPSTTRNPTFRRRDGRRFSCPAHRDVAGPRARAGDPQGHHQEIHECRRPPWSKVPSCPHRVSI